MRRAETRAAAWNRGDLEAVLAPIAEEAAFTSPLAAGLTGSPLIEARRRSAATGRMPSRWPARLLFFVEQAIWNGGSRALLILYVSRHDGGERRCWELMCFDRDGRQMHGEGYYGAEEPFL